MPVRPIDLQINISQMDHVSKAQASSKEAYMMAQASLTEKVEKEAERIAYEKTRETQEEDALLQYKEDKDRKKKEPSFKKGEIHKEGGVLTNFDGIEEDNFRDEGIGFIVDLKG